jgi:hypothetical protein
MRALLLSLSLFALFALSACTDDAVFVIDVTAPGGLEGREFEIQRLRVSLDNNGVQDVLLFPEDGPVAVVLPTSLSFSLPKEREGLINVTIEALDDAENTLGSGAGGAELARGQRTRFEVQLDPAP